MIGKYNDNNLQRISKSPQYRIEPHFDDFNSSVEIDSVEQRKIGERTQKNKPIDTMINNFSSIEHKKSTSISKHISSDVDSNSMYSFNVASTK